jgi:PAS domain-containing protein
MEEFLLNSPFPVLRMEREGTFLYANEVGESVLEVIKSRVRYKFPVEILDTLRRVALLKKNEQMDLKAGKKIFSITFNPLLAGECTILNESNITPFKQAEEKLFLRDRENEVLFQIAELELKTPDFQTLLNEILMLVATTLDVEYCKILKLLPDGNYLFETGIGWKPDYISKIVSKDLASRAGYTVIANRPILLEKLNEKNSFQIMELEEYNGIKSGIIALIGNVEKPYGVIVAHSTKKEKFTKGDANFLGAVSILISLIGERKEMEDTLRNKLNFLEILVDTIPVPVFYKDQKGVYQGCNELFAKMILGSSKEKVTGRSIDELFEVIPEELGDIYKKWIAN